MNWNVINTWLRSQGLEDFVLRQVAEVVLIGLITALLSFFVYRFFSHIERQFLKTKNLWDDTLLHAARPPTRLMIWVVGASWMLYSVQRQSGVDLSALLNVAQRACVIFCLTWFIVRFISGAEKIVICAEKMKEPMDETTVSAVGKLLRAVVIIVAVLVVLQTMGYSISGVLAFGGVGGLAVGFAAKDLLANFFGGLMVYLDRPFKVGDWVRSPDKEIEGTVVKIGWRLTTIRTFDKRPLYVPNAAFTSISVQNPSRMSHRRIYETIGLRYDDAHALEAIIQKVKQMLVAHEEIDERQTLIVNFNAYAASSLDFFVYTFTKTTDWIKFHEVKQDVLFKILEIIEEAGAEVAFPTSTISVPEGLTLSEGVVLRPSDCSD
mgnify:FL=1